MGTSSSRDPRRDEERRRREEESMAAAAAGAAGQPAAGAGGAPPPPFASGVPPDLQSFALMFGGQEMRYGPMPNFDAALRHRAAGGRVAPPPPAQVQETITVRNWANLRKKSLHLRPLPDPDKPDQYQVVFTADCDVIAKVEVFFGVVEVRDNVEGGAQSHGFKFSPQNPALPYAVPSSSIGPGSSLLFMSPATHPLDTRAFKPHLHYSTFMPNLYPLVIVLSYTVPNSVSDNSDEAQALKIQSQYTYAEIVRSDPTLVPTGGGTEASAEHSRAALPQTTSNYTIRILKQKLGLGNGHVYDLEEIYGMGGEGGEGNKTDGGGEADTCVVCITQERTTAAMPCRHMCLCSDCAEELRRHSNRCPICRAAIERLVTIQHRRLPPAVTSTSASPTTNRGSIASPTAPPNDEAKEGGSENNEKSALAASEEKRP